MRIYHSSHARRYPVVRAVWDENSLGSNLGIIREQRENDGHFAQKV